MAQTKPVNSPPFPSYELYLDVKKGCVITLVVLAIFALIGMMYLGTTEWGHNVFEKIKAFLATQMTLRDVVYMVLGTVVGCGLIYAIPCVVRRIDSCCALWCAKPIIFDPAKRPMMDLPPGTEVNLESDDELSAEAFDSDWENWPSDTELN